MTGLTLHKSAISHEITKHPQHTACISKSRTQNVTRAFLVGSRTRDTNVFLNKVQGFTSHFCINNPCSKTQFQKQICQNHYCARFFLTGLTSLVEKVAVEKVLPLTLPIMTLSISVGTACFQQQKGYKNVYPYKVQGLTSLVEKVLPLRLPIMTLLITLKAERKFDVVVFVTGQGIQKQFSARYKARPQWWRRCCPCGCQS